MFLLPYLGLLPLISAYAIVNIGDRFAELPVCDECGQAKKSDAPGIGIHLTASYATAAVRYANGSVDDLVKVEANADYKDLIARLAIPSSSPKCEGSWGKIWRHVDRTKRQWNKRLGRPATEAVGVLASFLDDIHNAAEKKLGSASNREIFPIFPRLPGLDEEDVRDAIQYARLTMPITLSRFTASEASAAFAGAGHGLCEQYTDIKRCLQEEKDMKAERVLYLNFDGSSFSVALQYMRNAHWHLPEASFLDLGLGRSQLPDDENERLQFWARVQEAIIGVGGSLTRPPNQLLVVGEHADDPDFRETVKNAVWDLIQFDVSLMLEQTEGKQNALYLTARGAAHLSTRARQLQPSCAISERCQIIQPAGSGKKEQDVFAGELR